MPNRTFPGQRRFQAGDPRIGLQRLGFAFRQQDPRSDERVAAFDLLGQHGYQRGQADTFAPAFESAQQGVAAQLEAIPQLRGFERTEAQNLHGRASSALGRVRGLYERVQEERNRIEQAAAAAMAPPELYDDTPMEMATFEEPYSPAALDLGDFNPDMGMVDPMAAQGPEIVFDDSMPLPEMVRGGVPGLEPTGGLQPMFDQAAGPIIAGMQDSTVLDPQQTMMAMDSLPEPGFGDGDRFVGDFGGVNVGWMDVGDGPEMVLSGQSQMTDLQRAVENMPARTLEQQRVKEEARAAADAGLVMTGMGPNGPVFERPEAQPDALLRQKIDQEIVTTALNQGRELSPSDLVRLRNESEEPIRSAIQNSRALARQFASSGVTDIDRMMMTPEDLARREYAPAADLAYSRVESYAPMIRLMADMEPEELAESDLMNNLQSFILPILQFENPIELQNLVSEGNQQGVEDMVDEYINRLIQSVMVREQQISP